MSKVSRWEWLSKLLSSIQIKLYIDGENIYVAPAEKKPAKNSTWPCDTALQMPDELERKLSVLFRDKRQKKLLSTR